MDTVQINIPVASINNVVVAMRNLATVGAYTWFVSFLTMIMVCDTPTPPNNVPQDAHILPGELPLLFRLRVWLPLLWMGFKVTVVAVGLVVAASLAWWFYPRGVGLRDLFTGTLYDAYTTGLLCRWDRYETERDRRLLRLQGALGARGIVSTMEDGALADVPNEELAADHIKFATKWAMRAKVEFQLPGDTPANRMVVAKWLTEQWKEQHVRHSLRVKSLQPAVDLSFVRTASDGVGADAAAGFTGAIPPPA